MEKSILITGCSSGIGRDAAKTLQEKGYSVYATARKTRDVESLKAEGLTAFVLDVDRSESIDQALRAVLESTGGTLYALFNNAGFGIPGAVEDLTREAMRAQFETNLFGATELICKVIPVMHRQGYGRIIQNSSVLGFAACAFRGAYNSSKFAMEGITDTLRLELYGTNIHVSLIEPGPIATKFRGNAHNAFKHYIDRDNSRFSEKYNKIETRLRHQGAAVPFTLPSSSVVRKLIHALEARTPKARYYVTVPTYILATLKWLLPTRLMDKVLLRAL